MKTFALIGAAGYIAPRHMKAIRDVGGTLVAAMDKHDSVGILDSYFPECDFFTEYEIFERYLYKNPVDYMVVCTPNYLHYPHIALGLHAGCDVICEKPVVLTVENVDSLCELEVKTGRKCYTVLQLREHLALNVMDAMGSISIRYHTPRGKWYHHSWKGDANKSGGILMNIGVHLFDWLLHQYGLVVSHCEGVTDTWAEGQINFATFKVDWSLRIDASQPLREIIINGRVIDFTQGFTDLHTKVYESILAGRGVRIEETREVIKLINEMR